MSNAIRKMTKANTGRGWGGKNWYRKIDPVILEQEKNDREADNKRLKHNLAKK